MFWITSPFIRFKHSWSPPTPFLYLTYNYLPYSQKYTGSTILSLEEKRTINRFTRKGGWGILSILDTKWWNYLFKYPASKKTIPFPCRIDPYEDNPRSSLTWGSTLNHSLNHANVEPFIANTILITLEYFRRFARYCPDYGAVAELQWLPMPLFKKTKRF